MPGFWDQRGNWVEQPYRPRTGPLPCNCDARVTGGPHRPWCPEFTEAEEPCCCPAHSGGEEAA